MTGRHRADVVAAAEHGANRVRIQARPVTAATLYVAALGAGVGVVLVLGHGFAIYGVALASLLSIKLIASLAPARRYSASAGIGLRVGVLVPAYNEDPAVLRACLDSLMDQDHPPLVVIVTDDGSDVPVSLPDRVGVYVVRSEVNHGKREATRRALRSGIGAAASAAVDVWCTVDSDTVLHRSAISAGVRPFTDPRIQATTGTVLALNRGNLVSRLVGLRYVNAFLGERAAYSRVGGVLCCCGSLAFYRASLVARVLDEWADQRFMGKPVSAGDDRRMTRHALDAGRVELVAGAIAFTMVPERFGHLVRQQVRWGRSFWRESFLMLATGSPLRIGYWLSALEVATNTAFTVALVAALVHAAITGPAGILGYLGWVAVTSWARSVHVLSVRGQDSGWRLLGTFALAPVYGLASLFVFLPLRLWSLITLRSVRWGTRSDGAEVTLAAGT